MNKMRWEKVFVSYSSIDLELAQSISDYLSRIGIEPYLAERLSTPDVHVYDKIAKNILDSNCFVAILTQNGITSQWVNQEIGFAYALQRQKVHHIPIYRLVEQSLEAKAIKGFLAGREHIQMDLNNLGQSVYELRENLRAYINRNVLVLKKIKVVCKSCNLPYEDDLPSLEVLRDVLERDQVILSICPNANCRTRNELDPRTLDVI